MKPSTAPPPFLVLEALGVSLLLGLGTALFLLLATTATVELAGGCGGLVACGGCMVTVFVHRRLRPRPIHRRQ